MNKFKEYANGVLISVQINILTCITRVLSEHLTITILSNAKSLVRMAYIVIPIVYRLE